MALVSTVIAPPGQANRASFFLLHGIYGRGRNWAAVARGLAQARPEWQSVLVDLRGHGDSRIPPPPHTVNSCAADVVQLEDEIGLKARAVLGHSFGGKVALAFADAHPRGLAQVWLIDSTPVRGVPDGSAWRMLQVARANPGPFPSREAVVAVICDAGFTRAVASWMASNVVWQDNAYRWRLDFQLMEALLRDFFERDAWSLIDAPPDGLTIQIVKGTESSLLTEDACARIEEAGRRHGRVRLHYVAGGHWLHTDNPAAVTSLLVSELPNEENEPPPR
jgi:pimeloyl-ACP methyl ester carboxylesterase